MAAKKGGATPTRRGRAAPTRTILGRTPETMTAREKLFVERYLIHFCGARAAREAGYSEKHAKGMAHQLLRETPRVVKAVGKGRERLRKANEATQEKVIDELAWIAFGRGDDFRHGDKIAALDKLGKHFGTFVDKVEVTGANGGPIAYADLSDEEIDKKLKALGVALDGGR